MPAGQYLSFGFTSTSPIDLERLDLSFSSALGPSVVDIVASFDGRSFETLLSIDTPFQLSPYMPQIELTGRSAMSAEFRIIGSRAARSDGILGFNTITGTSPPSTIRLTGTVRAVPEPSTFAALAIALGCFGVSCRRTKKVGSSRILVTGTS